jgi:hypothetical protein
MKSFRSATPLATVQPVSAGHARTLAAAAFAVLAIGCGMGDEPHETPRTMSALTAHNAVTTWHENAQALVGGFAGRGNAAQAYTSALIQVAVYDAVVAILGGYEPFIAHIDAPAGADLEAAIATAAYRVGVERVNVSAARAGFIGRYDAFMAAIPAGQAKTDGIAAGEAAAQAVLAARAGDNFYNTSAYTNPPADPGVWQATSVTNVFATAGANDYQMAFVVPLTASSPVARRAPPPPNMNSARYAFALHEVQVYGRSESESRTDAMTDVVQFWTESGFTLWQRNTRYIVINEGLDELESARVLAAVGVAGADGMLACFENKYFYANWRPFQAIHGADNDGNPFTEAEANWTPLVRANHPEYPAGHGCYGSAMATSLKMVFGRDFPVTLTSTGQQVPNRPVVPSRSYDSLTEIVDDNADARVWGGLHFRTTMEQSARWIKDVTNEALCGRFGITCSD